MWGFFPAAGGIFFSLSNHLPRSRGASSKGGAEREREAEEGKTERSRLSPAVARAVEGGRGERPGILRGGGSCGGQRSQEGGAHHRFFAGEQAGPQGDRTARLTHEFLDFGRSGRGGNKCKHKTSWRLRPAKQRGCRWWASISACSRGSSPSVPRWGAAHGRARRVRWGGCAPSRAASRREGRASGLVVAWSNDAAPASHLVNQV